MLLELLCLKQKPGEMSCRLVEQSCFLPFLPLESGMSGFLAGTGAISAPLARRKPAAGR